MIGIIVAMFLVTFLIIGVVFHNLQKKIKNLELDNSKIKELQHQKVKYCADTVILNTPMVNQKNTEKAYPSKSERQHLFEKCIEVVKKHKPDNIAYGVKKILPDSFQFRLDIYGCIVDDYFLFVEVDDEQKINLLMVNGRLVMTLDNITEFIGWLNRDSA